MFVEWKIKQTNEGCSPITAIFFVYLHLHPSNETHWKWPHINLILLTYQRKTLSGYESNKKYFHNKIPSPSHWSYNSNFRKEFIIVD